MLNEQTFEKLYAMKLHGISEAFKEQLAQPVIALAQEKTDKKREKLPYTFHVKFGYPS